MVGAFVHLYHIWGLFGAITACIFARQAYISWRASGGVWITAPCEWLYFIGWTLRETLFDLARCVIAPWRNGPWPQSDWSNRAYPREQSILIGIAMGGTGRMITALYWSETNRTWMTHADAWNLYAASAPVLLMILGDFLHHQTAWPNHRYRSRLLTVAALLWIATGAIKG
jgi:hypothetical protein